MRGGNIRISEGGIYEVLINMASGGMIYTPTIMKICTGVQAI
jgi:hypothetical protein